MSTIQPSSPASIDKPRSVTRPTSAAVPFEGEDGLFTQSWFPICVSSAATQDFVRGFDFLDGRVIVFRDADNRAHVKSAYCPHMGADLSIGDMVDGNVRCVFHHWQYGASGRCIRTPGGEPPPPTARLFEFPTMEKYGLVWAYNGVDPHYEIPGLPYPDEELVYKIKVLGTAPVDPWILVANTPDIQHIKYLHGIQLDGDDPHAQVEWTDHSMFYNFGGAHPSGQPVSHRVGIVGTSMYWQASDFGGQWFGFVAPFGMPRPNKTIIYFVVAARKDMGSAEEIDQFLDFVLDVETKVVVEDMINMDTIHFHPGVVTRADLTLTRFFDYMRQYPRAHPSNDFIK